MKLSAKAQSYVAARNTPAKFPFLIKIEHEDDKDFPMRFVNSDKDVTYEGEIYYAASFAIDPPDRNGSKIGDATLTISAIDQFWIQKIRENQKPATITFKAVIQMDNNGVEQIETLEEIDFTLRAVRFNEYSITWTMLFDENLSINIPCDECNTITTPGYA